MKLFSAHIEDLRTLYIDNLKKALDMEQTIVKSLPDLIENSSDTELKDAFRTHLDETRSHASTVERILLDRIGEAETNTCKVMSGLAAEVGSSRVDLQACKLEYSIVSPK